jgi:hypothetical protein
MHSSRALPLIALLTFFPLPAYAYLDPGTGSLIVQSIIGAIAVGAASVSVFWTRLKGLIFRGATTIDRKGADKR